MRLLLSCCRAPRAPEAHRLVGDALAAAGAAGERHRWDGFLHLARGHGLAPLACAHLSAHAGIPPEVTARLAEEADRVARSTLVQTAILHELVGDLSEAGIDVRVLKGLPLGATHHGDPALRPVADLDLLVRPRELRPAAAVLARRGYALLEDYGPVTPRRLEAMRRAGKHYHLVEPATRSHVELHWEPVSATGGARRAPEDLWWAPARTVELAGRPVPVLDEPRGLVQLAAHGGGHLWERLIWVTDVAEELRRLPPDAVGAALRLARPAGLDAHLVAGAALATDGLGTPLPLATRRLLHEATGSPSGRRAYEAARGLAAARASSAPTGTARRLWAGAPWNGGRAATVRRLVDLALMPSPSDWLAVPLPDRLFPLYRFVRPARIALKYARGPSGAASSERPR